MSDKIKNIVISIGFSLMLVFIMILNLISKDKDMSVSERRKLTSFPKITVNSLFNGTVSTEFDKYVVDQFIYRDNIRENKVKLDLIVKNNYHDVYKYNDYLINMEYPLNDGSVNNIVKIINSISDKYLDSSNKYFVMIPDKNYFVNNGNLKIDYDKLSKMMIQGLDDIKYIDIFDSLSLEDYYYSDSHFKQENIIDTSNVILRGMGINVRDISYNINNIGMFKGVYSYQVPVKIKEDYIRVLSNNYIDNVIVYDNLNNIDINVYDNSRLNSYDLYDVYLGGAKGLITINNNLIDSDKELVVFRDSFGSSLIPLFISYYKKIVVIDTRYISSNILSDYVDFKGQDVLFLYSVSTINNSYTLK